MNSLKLNSSQIMAIESEGKRVRLVVYKNGVEEVCRKENLSKLTRFIASENERIFKGRLQLFKTSKGIDVEVKNEIVGTISADNFLSLLQIVGV